MWRNGYRVISQNFTGDIQWIHQMAHANGLGQEKGSGPLYLLMCNTYGSTLLPKAYNAPRLGPIERKYKARESSYRILVDAPHRGNHVHPPSKIRRIYSPSGVISAETTAVHGVVGQTDECG
jgi:hypothetical protein